MNHLEFFDKMSKMRITNFGLVPIVVSIELSIPFRTLSEKPIAIIIPQHKGFRPL
jgi:hypothetical protein